MTHTCFRFVIATVLIASLAAPAAQAELVRGGGNRKSDCIAIFDIPGANKPEPPKVPRHVDCVDGDPTCDADGVRNGRCEFDLSVCVNSQAFLPDCSPVFTDSVEIEHSQDDGDPKFDPEFQALQVRVDLLEFPDNMDLDSCTTVSALTVVLKGPNGQSKMRKQRKKVRSESLGFATGKSFKDRDRMRFVCRPEGDKVYSPTDLFSGTFDRIAQQVFAQSCGLSACHDSESAQNNLELLPTSAYSQIVDVDPVNAAALNDGLKRIFPGDTDLSYLYRKITGNLDAGYGAVMPLNGASVTPELTEIIRLWILGDGVLGPAPETGWVPGTDQ